MEYVVNIFHLVRAMLAEPGCGFEIVPTCESYEFKVVCGGDAVYVFPHDVLMTAQGIGPVYV